MMQFIRCKHLVSDKRMSNTSPELFTRHVRHRRIFCRLKCFLGIFGEENYSSKDFKAFYFDIEYSSLLKEIKLFLRTSF